MRFTTSINKNYIFKQLYTKGTSLKHYSLITCVRKNRLNHPQIGITASTKIGNAVERNRAKRIIKESYRLLEPLVHGGYDIVFIARKTTVSLKTGDIMPAMKKHLVSLGVIVS